LPGLKPAGVNEKGEAADIAALETTEEALLANAEAMGMQDALSTAPARSLH
jgi:hypothetical protein